MTADSDQDNGTWDAADSLYGRACTARRADSASTSARAVTCYRTFEPAAASESCQVRAECNRSADSAISPGTGNTARTAGTNRAKTNRDDCPEDVSRNHPAIDCRGTAARSAYSPSSRRIAATASASASGTDTLDIYEFCTDRFCPIAGGCEQLKLSRCATRTVATAHYICLLELSSLLTAGLTIRV